MRENWRRRWPCEERECIDFDCWRADAIVVSNPAGARRLRHSGGIHFYRDSLGNSQVAEFVEAGVKRRPIVGLILKWSINMGMLQDKVALITGSASGIGRGIARRFVKEGAKVVLMDLSEQALTEITRELGVSAVAVVGDVCSWSDNQKAVSAALNTFGKLDVYVGNAGIYDHALALEDMEGEALSTAFDELFSINVKGYVLGMRASLDALLASRGNVVLTGSFASSSPAGGGVLYTASKHAVLGLVKQMAYELAPDIRVNGVAPGIAPTLLKGVKSLGQTPKDSILDGAQAIIPLQAVPDADVYGGMYAMLASDVESAHITGSMLTADSGLAVRGFGKAGGRVNRS